jgi:hypothetical protein
VSIAATQQRVSTTTEMHDRLVAYACEVGVTPEVVLAVRSRYWPACDVFEFAMETGMDLPVLLSELDRFIDYV